MSNIQRIFKKREIDSIGDEIKGISMCVILFSLFSFGIMVYKHFNVIDIKVGGMYLHSYSFDYDQYPDTITILSIDDGYTTYKGRMSFTKRRKVKYLVRNLKKIKS